MPHTREEAEREEKHKTIEERESWSECRPGTGGQWRILEQVNRELKMGDGEVLVLTGYGNVVL